MQAWVGVNGAGLHPPRDFFSDSPLVIDWTASHAST